MDERKVLIGSGLPSIHRHLLELAANRMEQGERIVVSIPRRNGMEELEKQFKQFREVKMNRAERRTSKRKKRRQ